MATLDDRLDFVLGKKAADQLDEYFGIRTVGELIRYFPRKYSDAMTTRGEGEALDLREGEHGTFVDTITNAETKWTNRTPKRDFLVVTLGQRRPKVTATFFNPRYLKKTLVAGARVMLSGEVGYYRGTMQLTHPAFMVLGTAGRRNVGTKALTSVATATGASGDDLLAEFEKEFFPIYPASAKMQTWEIYACVRQALDVLDPIPESLPKTYVREHGLMSEDEALRAIRVAETEVSRDRAIERLTHDEAVTLFHEFGHGLHHMLTEQDVSGISGINGVAWDAVELPSQFLENWCWTEEGIALISGHYETGEPLPKEKLEKMLAAKNFQGAMQMVRQLEFSLFDMRIHAEYQQGMDIYQVLKEVREQVAVIQPPAFNRFPNSFGHIFAGGYAAGYYSYKWAEVLSADAYSRFEEEGEFNEDTGRAFRSEILAKGGSREPMELFKAFRGREPSVEPLLRHCGING